MLLNGFFWINQNNKALFTTPGLNAITLQSGKYKVTLRGAGGAGGGSHIYLPSKSGRGGQGKITTAIFTLTDQSVLNFYVGNGGIVGGNGGLGGTGEDGNRSQSGGGGGEPTYIYVNGTYYYANGGGGGGGAGSGMNVLSASGGGGGGGYYRFYNGSIISVPGANGGNYAAGAGGNGNTQDFPSLYGQHGGSFTYGSWNAGGPGGTGGGAGGGAGTTQGSLASTQGGGGAGGDMESGGGTGGANNNSGQQTPTHNAGLYEPIDTTAENAQYGVIGNYGSSGAGQNVTDIEVGTDPTDGVSGFVLIERVA